MIEVRKLDNIELAAVFPIAKPWEATLGSIQRAGGILESVKWKKTTYTVKANFGVDMPETDAESGRVEGKIIDVSNGIANLGGKVKTLTFEVKMM